MRKSDLCYEVSRRTNLSVRAVDLVLGSTLEAITDHLARGETITLAGFGTFSPQKRAARTGRNPHTKQPVYIPACVKPRFKAGKELLAAVSGKKESDKK